MSRLKKFVYRVIGKNKKQPVAEKPISHEEQEKLNRDLERKKRLKENGIVFLLDQKVKTREGLTFHLKDGADGGTDIGTILEVFCTPDYYFKNNKSDTTVVIDMGMNVGIASLYFASRENVAKVYSFEPFAPTYGKALENIKLNPVFAKKITAFNFGLGKENTTLEIPYCTEISGEMSTTIDRLGYVEEYHDKTRVMEKVEIKSAAETLLPILNSLTTECVVLKIDTEGAEFDILESLDSSSLLEKVDFIMMEHHYRSPRILEDILTKNSFVVIYRYPFNENAQLGLMYAANIGRRKQA